MAKTSKQAWAELSEAVRDKRQADMALHETAKRVLRVGAGCEWDVAGRIYHGEVVAVGFGGERICVRNAETGKERWIGVYALAEPDTGALVGDR